MRFVYNPNRNPLDHRNITIPGLSYKAVPREVAQEIQATGADVIVEGDPRFKPLFERYDRRGTPVPGG